MPQKYWLSSLFLSNKPKNVLSGTYCFFPRVLLAPGSFWHSLPCVPYDDPECLYPSVSKLPKYTAKFGRYYLLDSICMHNARRTLVLPSSGIARARCAEHSPSAMQVRRHEFLSVDLNIALSFTVKVAMEKTCLSWPWKFFALVPHQKTKEPQKLCASPNVHEGERETPSTLPSSALILLSALPHIHTYSHIEKKIARKVCFQKNS